MQTKKVTYTPGPWTQGGAGYGGEGAILQDVTGLTIATVGNDVPRWKANARLIAAAPALADALEQFVRFYGEFENELDPHNPADLIAIHGYAALRAAGLLD